MPATGAEARRCSSVFALLVSERARKDETTKWSISREKYPVLCHHSPSVSDSPNLCSFPSAATVLGGTLDDFYALDLSNPGSGWATLALSDPQPAQRYGGAFAASQGAIYLFGGYGGPGLDTWIAPIAHGL